MLFFFVMCVLLMLMLMLILLFVMVQMAVLVVALAVVILSAQPPLNVVLTFSHLQAVQVIPLSTSSSMESPSSVVSPSLQQVF